MKMVKRALAAGSALMLASSPAMAAWDLNLRVGVTELSRESYGLHMLILWICVAIAVAVFGVMIYSIATFRKSKGAVPATFDHSTGFPDSWKDPATIKLKGKINNKNPFNRAKVTQKYMKSRNRKNIPIRHVFCFSISI